MTDVFISWEDTKDPQACRTNPDVFDQVSIYSSFFKDFSSRIEKKLTSFLITFSSVVIRHELQCNGMTQKMLDSVLAIAHG